MVFPFPPVSRLLLLLVLHHSLGAAYSSWPQFGFDSSHTFRSVYSGPRSVPRLVSSVDVSADFLNPGLVASGNVVFLSGLSSVVAINLSTKKVAWQTEIATHSSLNFAPVIAGDGSVVAQDLLGGLFSLSQITGKLRWQSAPVSASQGYSYISLDNAGNIISSAPVPAAHGSATTLVRKIRPNGSAEWSFNYSVAFRKPDGYCACDSQSNVFCLIERDSDADFSELVALDGKGGGRLVWNTTLTLPSGLALLNEHLILILYSAYDAGSDFGGFVTVESKTGKILRRQSFSDTTTVALLALAENGVFVTYHSHGLLQPKRAIVATDIHSGAHQWRIPVNGTLVDGSMGADGILYVALRPAYGTMHDFVQLSAIEVHSGRLLWTVEATPSMQGSSASGPIILSDGTLVLMYGTTIFGWK